MGRDKKTTKKLKKGRLSQNINKQGAEDVNNLIIPYLLLLVTKQMPVKKSELAARLAEKMGVTKKQGVEWLDAFVDEVTNVMRKGDKVNITGFGIFKVSDRKAREGRNPRTGETIQIKASKKPRFTPGKLLKEAIK